MSLPAGLAWGGFGFALASLVLKTLAITAFGLPAGGWAFVAVAALSAGVLEESVRAGLLHARRPAGRALAGFAAGWALAEWLLVGVGGLLQLLLLQADPEALAAARAGLPAPAFAALQRQIDSLSLATAFTWPVERMSAFVLQLGFTAWLARTLPGACAQPAGLAITWLIAVLAHALVDVPAAGYQAGWWPLGPVLLLYLGVALALAPWVLRWWYALFRLAPAPAAATH